MKKIFTVLVFLFTQQVFAVTLLCAQQGMDDYGSKYAENKHNLINGEVESTDCLVLDVKKGSFHTEEIVSVSIKQKGIGLKYTGYEGFMINCPLVTKVNRLTRSAFYGVKVSASAIVGGTVGIFSNKRLGMCILTALSAASYGLDFSGAKMSFE